MLRTKEAALQALGCLGIARPRALLLPEAQAAMSEALQRSSPALLKMRGLHSLAELLKASLPACLRRAMRMLLSKHAAERQIRLK